MMMEDIDTSWLLVAANLSGRLSLLTYGWSIERVAYRPVRNSSV